MCRQEQAFPGIGEPALEELGAPSPAAYAEQVELRRVHNPDRVGDHVHGEVGAQVPLAARSSTIGAHVAHTACAQLVCERPPACIRLSPGVQHGDQGRNALLQGADGVGKHLGDAGRIRFSPNLPHDLPLQSADGVRLSAGR